jgi:hypothetical protein
MLALFGFSDDGFESFRVFAPEVKLEVTTASFFAMAEPGSGASELLTCPTIGDLVEGTSFTIAISVISVTGATLEAVLLSQSAFH